MVVAAGARDGYRGRLPAEPDGHGGGGDRRGHREHRQHRRDGRRRAQRGERARLQRLEQGVRTVRKLAGATCVDPVTVKNGKRFRFEDNGHYIGHDEPSVKFISSSRGSGNTMTYLTKMPLDPSQPPTP